MIWSRRTAGVLAAWLLAVAMVGCSAPVAPVTSSGMASVVPSVVPSETSTVFAPVAPPTWVPSQPIQVPAPLSEAEMMKMRADYLKTLVKGNSIVDPPTVALVRWTAQSEWGTVMASCLQDAGFNVVDAGGGFAAPDGIGEAQQSALWLADYVCESKYTTNPTYWQTLTAAQWGLQYDYDVEWLVPCIAAFGITASTPPTRDTFIAQGVQSGSPDWAPYSEADRVYSNKPREQELLLYQTCPQDPPAQYMWGL